MYLKRWQNMRLRSTHTHTHTHTFNCIQYSYPFSLHYFKPLCIFGRSKDFCHSALVMRLWETLKIRYTCTGLYTQPTLKTYNLSSPQLAVIIIQSYFDCYFSWFWKLISEGEVKFLNLPPPPKMQCLRIGQAMDVHICYYRDYLLKYIL